MCQRSRRNIPTAANGHSLLTNNSRVMMKLVVLLAVMSSFSCVAFMPTHTTHNTFSTTTQLFGYVPDGMTPEQYRKLKAKEKDEMSKKKFGAFGPQSFKSRSLQAFQTDLEKGKAAHLMPMFNAKEKVKKGIIKETDIPYMQRQGSWDDSDLGKGKKWTDLDKNYEKKNQSPIGLDWSGNNQRRAPPQPAKNQTQAKKGGLFGLF